MKLHLVTAWTESRSCCGRKIGNNQPAQKKKTVTKSNNSDKGVRDGSRT